MTYSRSHNQYIEELSLESSVLSPGQCVLHHTLRYVEQLIKEHHGQKEPKRRQFTKGQSEGSTRKTGTVYTDKCYLLEGLSLQQVTWKSFSLIATTCPLVALVQQDAQLFMNHLLQNFFLLLFTCSGRTTACITSSGINVRIQFCMNLLHFCLSCLQRHCAL